MTAMRLKRYPSPSGGIALGKMGVGATMLKRLPYDAEVEWLESTGTQWIDTGFKANPATTRLECSLIPSTTSGTLGVCGSRDAYGTCAIFMITSGFRLDWLYGNTGSISLQVTAGTKYDIEITAGRAVVNGVVYTATNTQQTTQLYNFLLFNFSNRSASPFSDGFKGSIGYAKIYSNNTLVRDFIPVRFTNEQGQREGAMYDKRGVGGMNPDGSARNDGLYRNRGTDAFGYGNDI